MNFKELGKLIKVFAACLQRVEKLAQMGEWLESKLSGTVGKLKPLVAKEENFQQFALWKAFSSSFKQNLETCVNAKEFSLKFYKKS